MHVFLSKMSFFIQKHIKTFPKQLLAVGVLAVNKASWEQIGRRPENGRSFCICFYSVSAFEVHPSAAKWGLLAQIASPHTENGLPASPSLSRSICLLGSQTDPKVTPK